MRQKKMIQRLEILRHVAMPLPRDVGKAKVFPVRVDGILWKKVNDLRKEKKLTWNQVFLKLISIL